MLAPESINRKEETSQPIIKVQTATIVMIGITMLIGAIVLAWFAGEGRIDKIFTQINNLQQQPPLWLQVPMLTGEYLLAPTVILFLLAFGITKISPQPRPWSRFIVVSILLFLSTRYLLWRSFSTLHLNNPLNGVFSIALLSMEILVFTSTMINLFLNLKVRDRKKEAELAALEVVEGKYHPTVDILIPTYDEPEFILRRTVIGCQAINYEPKTIYLLDDTRRENIEALAAELGCEYITRPNNDHAKAGNLNHAIPRTKGELIVVFDADFIPTTNFLTRTVGFFANPQVGLVQTPQSFYNSDPVASNLGLENILTPEEEVFYRQIQPMRDGAGSVVCSGTSFIVRREAIESTGGFVTDSLSEDYFTGVRLAAQGYKLIYLDEKLSAGLAAENIAAHATQRLRWARGTLQAFFIKANPLTIKGLNLLQRLGHFEGLLHWFTTIPRIFFLLMPLAYSFLNVIPIRATTREILYFFIPYYFIHLTVFAWLNNRARSALLSDIYSLVLAFPLGLTVVQTMLNPFARGFKVTPKGTQSNKFNFNWKLASPLIIMFILTAVSLWRNLGICMVKGAWEKTVSPEVALQIKGIGLGWLWSGYNLIVIGIALLILLDIPRQDAYAWFDLRRVVKLTSAQAKSWWGVTTAISEIGMQVAVTQKDLPDLMPGQTIPVDLYIAEIELNLTGEITSIGCYEEYKAVNIKFQNVTLSQQRKLVEMLFCRPGQWKRYHSPGELQSLFLLFRILLRPRILFARQAQIRPLRVVKG